MFNSFSLYSITTLKKMEDYVDTTHLNKIMILKQFRHYQFRLKSGVNGGVPHQSVCNTLANCDDIRYCGYCAEKQTQRPNFLSAFISSFSNPKRDFNK